MGQKYEGTLIIQTTNDYSPVGSQTLAALENSAFSDDILSGKSLYSQNGQLLKGSFVDGWPIEIGTEEEMDAFATLDNVERYVKYVENNASVQPEPIVVGDTITQLYFNTSVVPDFSLLDWSKAEDVEGMPTLALINSDGLSAGQAHLRIVRADNTLIPTLHGIMYQLQNSVADGTNLYIQCAPEDVAFCEENGITPNQWIAESNPFPFDADVVVSVVNQQDIWGAYISKDGQWTSGAKYTSGQVYKVVQNGDIAELKEIQY